MIGICAINNKNGLGMHDGTIPWFDPKSIDAQWFKFATVSRNKWGCKHDLIMGRKTFEAIGKPLSDRFSIVLTSTKKDEYKQKFWFGEERYSDRVAFVSNLEELDKQIFYKYDFFDINHIDRKEFVVGGAGIFLQLKDEITEWLVTFVDDDTNCDVNFPQHLLFDGVTWSNLNINVDPKYKFYYGLVGGKQHNYKFVHETVHDFKNKVGWK